MRKFKNIKGSELAESYKKGWELAIKSFEKINPNDKLPPLQAVMSMSDKHWLLDHG